MKTNEYVISLKGAEIGRYELPAGCELAIPVGSWSPRRAARQTKEPAFGMTGWWVPAEQADAARRRGLHGGGSGERARHAPGGTGPPLRARAVLPPGCQEISWTAPALECPKVVEDLVPKLLPLSAVQRVLQNLLRESVSIRDSVTILEALGEAGVTTRNTVLLDRVRAPGAAPHSGEAFPERRRRPAAYLLDPALEQMVEAAIQHGEQTSHLTLAPPAIRDCLQRIAKKVGDPETPVAAISGSSSRYFLGRWWSPPSETCSSSRITKCPRKSRSFHWELFNSHGHLRQYHNNLCEIVLRGYR